MAQHSITLRERGGRGPPALCNSSLEHLIGSWHMVPYGDRRYRTKSGRAEYQSVIAPRNDRVVREFILHDDVGNDCRPDRAGWLPATPAEHIGQRL